MAKKIEDKRRIVLLTIAYLFAVAGTILIIVYFAKNGFKTNVKSINYLLDIGIICGGIFLVLKGCADNIKSYLVPVRDRHFMWVYARIWFAVGVLICLGGIISLVIHIVS
ncbi:MAG: hypothetical protein ACI4U5_01965 [Bacilli bacterium]